MGLNVPAAVTHNHRADFVLASSWSQRKRNEHVRKQVEHSRQTPDVPLVLPGTQKWPGKQRPEQAALVPDEHHWPMGQVWQAAKLVPPEWGLNLPAAAASMSRRDERSGNDALANGMVQTDFPF
eukprot:2314119-Prymnesium_polylepis.3